MKNIKFWQVLLLVALVAVVGCDKDDVTTPPVIEGSGELVINEFMASNDIHDVSGDQTFPDWIEIYNPGTEDINIGGWYMWDNLQDADTEWFQITAGTDSTIVPAGEWLVLFADKATTHGVLHLGIKLSGDGEDIILADAAKSVVYSLSYELQVTDISMGLNPDGEGVFTFLATATPGAANDASADNMAPVIDGIELDPTTPVPDADVTVNATIFDDSGIATVDLYWNVDGGAWTTVAMTTGGKVTASYTGVIPGQANGTEVGYYLQVTDSEGETVTAPAGAPTEFATYIPHFAVESDLYINEFMASNDSYDVDGTGNFPDWIEIYNDGAEAIDIGGMYISDDLGIYDWSLYPELQIPTTEPATTTIAPGGFLVLFADKESALGVLHLEIKLSGSGESVGLYGDDGHGNIGVFDSYTYASATADTSEGRITDGGDSWTIFPTPTIGTSNEVGK